MDRQGTQGVMVVDLSSNTADTEARGQFESVGRAIVLEDGLTTHATWNLHSGAPPHSRSLLLNRIRRRLV